MHYLDNFLIVHHFLLGFLFFQLFFPQKLFFGVVFQTYEATVTEPNIFEILKRLRIESFMFVNVDNGLGVIFVLFNLLGG